MSEFGGVSEAVHPCHEVAEQSVLHARSTSVRKADRNDGRCYACSGIPGTCHVMITDITPPRRPRSPALRTCALPCPGPPPDRPLPMAFFGRPDTDKLFPVIGFGGKLGPNQSANHAFAVNFNEDHPEVEGMTGVLEVRREDAGARR